MDSHLYCALCALPFTTLEEILAIHRETVKVRHGLHPDDLVQLEHLEKSTRDYSWLSECVVVTPIKIYSIGLDLLYQYEETAEQYEGDDLFHTSDMEEVLVHCACLTCWKTEYADTDLFDYIVSYAEMDRTGESHPTSRTWIDTYIEPHFLFTNPENQYVLADPRENDPLALKSRKRIMTLIRFITSNVDLHEMKQEIEKDRDDVIADRNKLVKKVMVEEDVAKLLPKELHGAVVDFVRPPQSDESEDSENESEDSDEDSD